MYDFEIQNGVLKKYYGDDEIVLIPNGVTEIGESAFEKHLVTAVRIPETVQVIGKRAFFSCKTLKTIVFPQKIQEIGSQVFWGCVSLTAVSLPEGLQKIESGTFAGCTALKTVNIPDTVTAVAPTAFLECCGLTGVRLPDTIVSVPDNAFSSQCLKEITYRNITFPFQKIPDRHDIQTITDIMELIRTKHLAGYAYSSKVHAVWELFFQNPEYEPLIEAIQKSFAVLFEFVSNEKDTLLAKKLLDTHQFVTKENIDKLISCAIDAEAKEIQLMLMHYKNEYIGYDSDEDIIRKKFDL